MSEKTGAWPCRMPYPKYWVLGISTCLGLLALLSACGHKKPPKAVPSPPVGHVQEGVSSWYGKEFDGRPTASGERFDMNGMTAAHRTLPLGTEVRVTNLENGQEADLRINDRGPFVRGRILDCSYGAAKSLGFAGAGMARVRIEVLREAPERTHRVPASGEIVIGKQGAPSPALDGSFTVQVGAFAVQDNALRLRDRLEKQFGDAYVIKFRDFYRVRVDHIGDEDEAELLRLRLQNAGLGEGFVTRNE